MAQIFTTSPALIIQSGKSLNGKWLLMPLATLAIYSMVIPVFILDVWTTVYQAIYFTAIGIPKISKKDYIAFDRWELRGLNLWQRINCAYCEYVNGLLAWAKSVSNQTEIYSCAIKHTAKLKGHEHQGDYYEYSKYK